MLAPDLIQIAGVIDEAEARMLRRCGVNYLGFPLRLPVHREDISEADAAKIMGALEPPAFGVLITYLDDAREIAAFSASLGARGTSSIALESTSGRGQKTFGPRLRSRVTSDRSCTSTVTRPYAEV